MNFRVTFHLDGSGVGYDPAEPLHLDALLAWAAAPRMGVRGCTSRHDPIEQVPLPLDHVILEGHWVWCASALMPVSATGEDVTYWRKRFRQDRATLTTGSPNLTNGIYRDWNTPLPLVLALQLVAYARGDRSRCKRLLKEVRALGKKRAHGFGKVTGIDYEEMADDWSIVKDGHAQRWLPTKYGTRLVRFQPPYWHPDGRVPCCEVGDKYED